MDIPRSLPSMAPRHTVHPVHMRTDILASLRYTTATDGGSADFAGAKICPPIPGHMRTGILASLRHTAHPWA